MEPTGLSAHPQLLQHITNLVQTNGGAWDNTLQQHAPSLTRLVVLQLQDLDMPFAVLRTLMAGNPALQRVHLRSIIPPADGSVGTLEQLPPALQELELQYIVDPLLLPWLPQVGCAQLVQGLQTGTFF
jgi:hypothetical protein